MIINKLFVFDIKYLTSFDKTDLFWIEDELKFSIFNPSTDGLKGLVFEMKSLKLRAFLTLSSEPLLLKLLKHNGDFIVELL